MDKRKLPLVILFCGLLAGGSLLTFLLPVKDFSPREKRYLQPLPRLTPDRLLDGDFTADVEKYMADHLPLREELVGLSAYFELAAGRNGSRGVYLGREERLFLKPVEAEERDLTQNLEALGNFAQASGLPASILAVPTAGAVQTGQLPAVHRPYQDAQLLETIRQGLEGKIDWVELLAPFSDLRQETLYYRTDHHWTSQGAYTAYAAFMEEKGAAPLPPSAFRVSQREGFYGTCYAKSGYWGVSPDTVEVWENPALSVRVTVSDEDGGETAVQDGPFFFDRLDEADKYPVFLNGNHSLVRLENPEVTGGRLLVVKDSFAHCLVPFFAAHYSRIDMIDLRYFKKQRLSDYLRENPCDELLFVYGLDSLCTDKSLRWLG
ncbi:MAG: hypothetical protein HFE86_04515 [Clostridiales bacterium]|nr:hypothetical protein [Clostridiales bacterium]